MDRLRKSGDSAGARVDVVATGVPPGLGEPVFDKLDADIAHAMMGINAVKGVEIGAGFRSVAQPGTEHRDEMTPRRFSFESRRRHPRRHLLRAGPAGQRGLQAHLEPAAALRRPGHTRPADHGRDDRPPRPLCRPAGHADRRGHAGARAHGSLFATSGPERGRRASTCRPSRPERCRHARIPNSPAFPILRSRRGRRVLAAAGPAALCFVALCDVVTGREAVQAAKWHK